MNKLKNISKELKDEIVNEYTKKPISLIDIGNMFGLHYVTISKILKEYKVPIYTKQQLCSMDLDEDYFESIDSEEKAYLLGFFLADGCIFDDPFNGSPKIIFGLTEKDSYIVKIFHNAINSSNKLRVDDRGKNPYITSVNSSYKIAHDLEEHGISYNKANRRLPVIRNDLMHHLIRGFFDGDGSFGYRLSHPERSTCNSYRGRVDIVAHEYVLPVLKKLLETEACIYNCRVCRVNSEMFLQCIDINRKEDILRFYRYIYRDANIYLHRKKCKFEEFFKLNNMINCDGTEITQNNKRF